MKPTHKTIHVPKSAYNRLRLSTFPSSGQYPNIMGMKQKYYGLDSYCIMCDNYLYHVDEKTYIRAKDGEY